MPDLRSRSLTLASAKQASDDPISYAIGDYGRWQLLITFLISLVNLPCTWNIFIPTFSAEAKEFWCSPPSHLAEIDPKIWINYSQPEGPCSLLDIDWSTITPETIEKVNISAGNLIDCTSWIWAGRGDTIISEWNLVCNYHYLSSLTEMFFLGGIAVGGLISGIASDHFGRKRALMVLMTLQTLIGLLAYINPWFPLHVICRAALGFISVGVVFSGFVLCIEMVGGLWRIVAGVAYLLPLSLAYITVAVMAWFLRKWRHLQLAISAPEIIFMLYWCILVIYL